MPLVGQIPRRSKRVTTRYDGHLNQRIGPTQEPTHRCVTALVVRHHSLLVLCKHLGSFLQTAYNAVDGIQEILSAYQALPLAGGTERRLVTHVGNIGT